MPSLSRFFGISIKMFLAQKEHNPPHIHAIYGEQIGEFDIRDGEQIVGDLTGRAEGLVREWVKLHSAELQEIWDTQEFRKIEGLK